MRVLVSRLPEVGGNEIRLIHCSAQWLGILQGCREEETYQEMYAGRAQRGLNPDAVLKIVGNG